MFKKVLPVVCVWSILFVTFNANIALAEEGKDGCPPTCNGPGGGIYYQPTMLAHVSVGNPAYNGQAPTKAELTVAANELQAWVNDPANASVLTQAQTYFNSHVSQIQNADDATAENEQALSFGSVIPTSYLNGTMLPGMGAANRQQAVAFIQQYGVKGTILQMVAYIQQLANEAELQGPNAPNNKAKYAAYQYNNNTSGALMRIASTGRLRFVYRDVDTYTKVADGLLLMGMIFAMVPGLEIVGGVCGIVGGTMILSGDYGN